MTRRESRPAATAPLATSNILSSHPVIEYPLFDQVRVQIYSEVDTLVSENESRPNYLMELLRAVQLLNTDYLRQTGLNSLKRVINNYLNPDQIDPQAFSSFPAPPLPFLPDTQLVQDEYVYSPTQNFPLVRHCLNSDKINPQAFSSFPAPPLPFLPDSQLVQDEYVYSPTQNFPLVRHCLNSDKIFLQALSSFPAPPLPFLPDTQLVQDEDVYSPTQNFPMVRHCLNPDKINPQALSSLPAPPLPFLPDTQLVQDEDVYSPTQNFPLVQHYLNTDLSDSSKNVDDRCVSRECQLPEAVQQLHTQADRHCGFGGSVESIDVSDYSEITTSESDLSDDEDTSFTGFTFTYPTCIESFSDEIAVCEESGDFSHSNTMDTISKTSLRASKTHIRARFRGQVKIWPTVLSYDDTRTVVMSGRIATFHQTVVTISIS